MRCPSPSLWKPCGSDFDQAQIIARHAELCECHPRRRKHAWRGTQREALGPLCRWTGLRIALSTEPAAGYLPGHLKSTNGPPTGYS